MSKRFVSVLIVVAILLVACPTANATAGARASNYLTSYSVRLTRGSNSGELLLSYLVSTSASGITRLGILSIFVYRTDGSLAKTIIGTTSNGLIQASSAAVNSTYSFTCEPGTAYYCNVTFIAENASGSDVRDRTTNTVVAPL